MKRYKLVDTTLREGEQTPDVLFTLEQKKQIIRKLVLSGVEEIELGIASPLNSDLNELVQFCGEHYPQTNFCLWSRCKKSDIDFAADSGIQAVSLSIPVSRLHIKDKLGKNKKWAVHCLKEAISYAKQRGLEVAVGFEDSTRAELKFLAKMAGVAAQHGVYRIRLADTVGIASPGKITELLQTVAVSAPNTPLGVHTHNDFGMATGNAIAALENGAVWADGAMLGLGERTGCAALEQLVSYLQLVMDDTTKKIKPLKELAEYLTTITPISIDKRSPVFGSDIFACETGLHLQGLLNEPKTYEPYAPEQVGAKRKLLLGAKSGRYAIQKKIQSLGIESMSEPVLEKCVKQVRQTARSLGRSLNNEEVIAICKM